MPTVYKDARLIRLTTKRARAIRITAFGYWLLIRDHVSTCNACFSNERVCPEWKKLHSQYERARA